MYNIRKGIPEKLLFGLLTLLVVVIPAGLASAQGTKSYKIFGPSYQNVRITGNSLNGAVYYLKSGHGGPDPGAMGKYGKHTLCEDEYAYDVTLRLGRRLIENGATVYFIIRDPNDGIRNEEYLRSDRDETCYPDRTIPLNQVERLRQRVNAVNALYDKNRGKFQRLISMHVDSRSKSKNIDVFFYYDKVSSKGKKAAGILKNTFEEKYNRHQPDRGYHGTVSARNLYVLTYAKPVSLFIELGNIHHFRDQKRIVSADNRQALANWLAEGLIKDYRTNK